MSAKIRVVIADDAEQLRSLLAVGLCKDGDIEVVGQAGDGASAFVAVAEFRPDVLLLDLSMPVLDGLEVLRRVVEILPEVAVLVFSGYGTVELAETCVELGAKAYLKKGMPMDQLRQAIRDAAGGRA